MKKLVIIGGMGNGSVALSTVEDINSKKPEWKVLGFLNDRDIDNVNGYPVLGKVTAEKAKELLLDPEVYFLYTLISAKLNFKFLSKLTDLKIPRERFATIVHPTAVVSKFAELGYGVQIHPFVAVGPNVKVGDHVQIYGQAMIGHNATMGNYSYAASNAVIGASVVAEEGAYFGTNCTVLENIQFGRWSLVGSGAVVLKNVPEFTKVVGNPARVIGIVE